MITNDLTATNCARALRAWMARSISVLAVLAFCEAGVAAPPPEYSNSYAGNSCSGCHALPPRQTSEIVTKGAAADVILNQVRNGSAAGNAVRDEKKLQLGRIEGREYAVVQANGNVAVTRIYWARGRLFQLVVDGRAGTEKLPETRKFVESFALVTEPR